MNQEQTYNNCENYEVKGKCLLIGEEVTKEFFGNVNTVDKEGNKQFSTTEEDDKLCSTCDSFKNRGS